MRLHAHAALLPTGWARDVGVELADGRIAAVTPSATPGPGDRRVDALVPGMPNLHSHTFQRGFSGLTEFRGPGKDSFWTWREAMYRFALQLDPEGVEAIAALACVEMLEEGYTRLGEFHYLHHDPQGRPYADPAELSLRVMSAAEATGIALTHLPVFYAHGGIGGAPATDGQRRFLHDLDGFERLMAACAAALRRPLDRLGLAPHSLRGATPDQIRRLAATWPGRPIHIHVAEQVKEVEDCLAQTGARPVEWLLDQAPVGPDWCLIHATHLTGAEVAGLLQSGSVAGLCPVTEPIWATAPSRRPRSCPAAAPSAWAPTATCPSRSRRNCGCWNTPSGWPIADATSARTRAAPGLRCSAPRFAAGRRPLARRCPNSPRAPRPIWWRWPILWRSTTPTA